MARAVGKYIAQGIQHAISFALGYFSGSSSEDSNSNDKNNGLVNNEIKIIEKESQKSHIEYMVYVVAFIICIALLFKVIKCIRQRKVKNTDTELDLFNTIV